MNTPQALAGTLHLQPGRPTPNIRSSRGLLARMLVCGKPADDAPAALAAVFTLCGDSHRLASRRAIDAARERVAQRAADDGTLQFDTLREHLRRFWLDWPRALAGVAPDPADLAVLRHCPLLRQAGPAGAKEALAATRAWIAVNLLDMAPAEWLEAWEADPQECLERWCARADTLPARLLAACRDAARALAGLPRPLLVAADAGSLARLAARLRADPCFALAPDEAGQVPETGPWTRLADRGHAHATTAWLRLGARLAEAVRLGLPDAEDRGGACWLRHGAIALAAGEGLAWCEMARGLLVHRVRLAPAGPGADRVVEYDVVAPTEWNFHPEGPVARALAALPPDADDSVVRLLAAAFDPCVAVHVERAAAGPPLTV